MVGAGISVLGDLGSNTARTRPRSEGLSWAVSEAGQADMGSVGTKRRSEGQREVASAEDSVGILRNQRFGLTGVSRETLRPRPCPER